MNQPLQAAAGNAELLLMLMKPGDLGYEKVSRINAQVMKLGEITRKRMGITRYETKDYPVGRIVDSDRSSEEES